MKKLVLLVLLFAAAGPVGAYVPTATRTGTPTITFTPTPTATPTVTSTPTASPTATIVWNVNIMNWDQTPGPTTIVYGDSQTFVSGSPVTQVNAYPTVQGVSIVGGISVTLINPTPVLPSDLIRATPTLTTNKVPIAVGPNALGDSTIEWDPGANAYFLNSIRTYELSSPDEITFIHWNGTSWDVGYGTRPLNIYGSGVTIHSGLGLDNHDLNDVANFGVSQIGVRGNPGADVIYVSNGVTIASFMSGVLVGPNF